ncbi:hypothetical protein M0804_013812 [Polistes exclamans]|nr:hypothetical protein M0804_013812 [Polistes exclamans]
MPYIVLFREFFRETNQDVNAVSESRNSSLVVDAQIWFLIFHLHRHDRKRRYGRIVLLFVRNTLSSRIVACSLNQNDSFPEYMIAEVWSSICNKVLISVIYRPPNTALLYIFKQDFDKLSMHYKNIVITGYLNINLLRDSRESINLNKFCKSHDLRIVPFNATYHTATSDT